MEYEKYTELKKLPLEKIVERMQELDKLVERSEVVEEVQSAIDEKEILLELRSEKESRADKEIETDGDLFVRSYGLGGKNMDIENRSSEKEIQARAFQSFITKGIANLDETEKRALDLSGVSAALPDEVMNILLSEEKFSDLIHRATILNQGGAGSIYIPVASNTSAAWKVENSDVDGESATYEASPTVTKLELKGYELYRWMRVSAAANAMTAGNFMNHMLELLSAEVIETLEKSFISGSGTGQPKGLDNLTWTPDTNQILTASAATPIAAADIAEALSLLPQKYARGAVVMCNASTLYDMALFKGTNEYAYNMADGATKFMGHDIIVNQHIADDVVYIVNPSQLYVRFAQPLQIEADRSSGFTAAAIDLRALTVVDAAWNPDACVSVGLGAS